MSTVAFNGPIVNVNQPNDLTVNGNAIFNGDVGDAGAGDFALHSLTVTGTTTLNPGLSQINTVGDQTFEGGLVLATNAVLTGSTINFGGAIQDENASYSLTIDGNVSFGGDVGAAGAGLFALNSLTVSGSTLLGPGLSEVNTVNGQTFSGAVTLGSSAVLTGSTVSFGRAIQDVNQANDLTVHGNASFGGDVGDAGAGLLALGSLTVIGTTTLGLGVSQINTTDDQSFTGAVTFGSDLTLTSTSSGNITFSDALDGVAALTLVSLGVITFLGLVGGDQRLSRLTTKGGGTTDINGGGVTTTGDQDYEEPVTLSADATFTSTDDGNLRYASTVTGPFALDVSTVGVTTFLGAVSVASLTTAPFGTTEIDGSGITTTGQASLNNNVVIGSQATINGEGGLTFGGTITKNTGAVEVDQRRVVLLGNDRGQPHHGQTRSLEHPGPRDGRRPGQPRPPDRHRRSGRYYVHPDRNPTRQRDIRGGPDGEPEYVPGRSQQ